MAFGSQYNVNSNRRSSGGSDTRDSVYNWLNTGTSNVAPNYNQSGVLSGSTPLGIVLSGVNNMVGQLVGQEQYYNQLKEHRNDIQSQIGLFNYGLEWNKLMQQEANALSYLQSQEANATELQMLSEANKFNVEQWERNNQYNSPASVLDRARAAGVNPNMAFGTNVASQPVQQSSVPSLHVGSYGAASSPSPPYNSFRKPDSNYNLINQIQDMVKAMMQIPEYQEKVRGMRLKNDEQQMSNEEKRDEMNKYKNFAFYVNPNDSYDIITADEYDSLSDDAKKRYQINDENGSSLPNLVKPGFSSKAGFDAFIQLHNLKKRFSDDSADISQNMLRKAVADGQLEDNEVTRALIDMPTVDYDLLMKQSSKAVQETIRLKNENSDAPLRHDYLDKSVQILNENLEEMKNTSLTGFIDKWKNEGFEWSDLAKVFVVLASRSALFKR